VIHYTNRLLLLLLNTINTSYHPDFFASYMYDTPPGN